MLDFTLITWRYFFVHWHLPQYVCYVLGVLILFLLHLLPLLLCIAIITWLERSTMSSMHRRRGPNNLGMWGSLQPIADGLNLVLTQLMITSNSSVYIFVVAPVLSLFCMLALWLFIPVCSAFVLVDLHYVIFFVLILGTINVQTVIYAGWGSNSNYAFLGGVRAASQMISYEICMSTVFASVILLSGSFSVVDIVYSQFDVWFVFILFPLWLLFVITSLAETNRTPFDLVEAEAELVAGYNVEYASVFFALIFIAEYGSILIMSALSTLFFFGGWIPPFCVSLEESLQQDAAFSWYSGFVFSIKTACNVFLFILVSATLPSYSYDQLMGLGWNVLIPFSFSAFIIQCFVIEFFSCY